jgi:cell division septation protein DedD
MKATGENNVWFAAMIALTIVAGGAACFMVIKKDEFFPSQYQSAHHGSEGTVDEHHQTKERDTTHSEAHGQAAEKIDEKNVEPHQENVAQYVLVVGSFSSNERANEFLARVATTYPDCHLISTERDGKKLFRVIAGKPNSRERIINLKNEMATKGFADGWIYEVKD